MLSLRFVLIYLWISSNRIPTTEDWVFSDDHSDINALQFFFLVLSALKFQKYLSLYKLQNLPSPFDWQSDLRFSKGISLSFISLPLPSLFFLTILLQFHWFAVHIPQIVLFQLPSSVLAFSIPLLPFPYNLSIKLLHLFTCTLTFPLIHLPTYLLVSMTKCQKNHRNLFYFKKWTWWVSLRQTQA